MSLKVNANEACIYASTCPYNTGQGQNFCLGASNSRPNIFVCDLVSDEGVFVEGGHRNRFDLNGKMKLILEESDLQ